VKNPFENARAYTGEAPGGKAEGEQKKNGKAKSGGTLIASSYQWMDEMDISPREFLHGRDLPRGSLSVDLAPGGLGKTSYKIAQALALVTGRPLLGHAISRQFRVWLYNLEDPLIELTRRIQAACKHYRISKEDLGDRLYVNGCETPLCITRSTGRSVIIDEEIIVAQMSEITDKRIDVFNIDPFVSSHRIPEKHRRRSGCQDMGKDRHR
jgi:RecA-family ATPase